MRRSRLLGRAWSFAIAALLLYAGVTPVRAEQNPATAGHPMIGNEAPGFTLEAVDGSNVDLTDYRGQYLVIHFGASW